MTADTLKALDQLCQRRTIFLTQNLDLRWHGDLQGHVTAITRTVRHNQASGRLYRLLGLAPGSRLTRSVLAGYIDRVVRFHHQTHTLVPRLQAHDDQAWQDLKDQLLRQAAKFLRQKGGQLDRASDFAQQACEIIYRKVYPCDVSFEAWACKILLNEVRRAWRSGDVLNQPPRLRQSVEILGQADELSTTGQPEPMPHDGVLDQLEQAEKHELILAAVAKLRSQAQQEVIAALYFQELDHAQAAQHLALSMDGLYRLHHRALKSLKRILEKVKDSDGFRYQS